MATQPYRAHYSSPEYARNRKARLEYAGGRCEACGQPLVGAFEAHHVVALRDGGDDSIENLRVLHPACHHPFTRQSRRSRQG